MVSLEGRECILIIFDYPTPIPVLERTERQIIFKMSEECVHGLDLGEKGQQPYMIPFLSTLFF